jgi:glycosyltransferase involved in cell wall biosynthesis
MLGIKIVWTVHNLKNHENRHVRLEIFFTSLLSRVCNAIIAHCETAKREIQRVFGVKNGDKIAVIPIGNYLNYYDNTISQDEARKRLGLSSSDLVFLFIGLIRPYRGIPELIEAFQQLNTNDAKLIIAGRPNNSYTAEQIKEKAKGNGNIQLRLEFIPDDEIQVYMNAADVVVLPYRDVFTSSGIILAMSFAKAVIAPAIGCIPDTLDEFGSLLYEPNEKDGLLKALSQITTYHVNLEKMGNHNLKLAESLDWDRIANLTREVYEQCLGD